MNKKMPRMQQRTIDFDRPRAEEQRHVDISTSLPPPAATPYLFMFDV